MSDLHSAANALPSYISMDALKIALVLALSFLIGLEREERKVREVQYAFGGVRTFPLIGLVGFALAMICGTQPLPIALGLMLVGAFMLLSYRHKLATSESAGITTEFSGLLTFLCGALVYYDRLWIATALMVASVLLLELKSALEKLTRRIAAEEIISFAKFLLLSAVILPIVPNQSLTRFEINPFKTWLVVVAVSGISYGSYVLQKVARGRGGVFLSGLLGGVYSSTLTTLVLARRAREPEQAASFTGAILAASGMMYVRLGLLLALFNRALLVKLGPPFAVLAVLAVGTGWFWSRRRPAPPQVAEVRNPLELGAALLFGGLFVLLLIGTHLTLTHLGRGGVYSLAALMGVTDVDPFVLGLTQSGGATPTEVAAVGIVIAAASNNVIKGVYALAFADRKTGRASLLLLLGLAALGLLPWLWI